MLLSKLDVWSAKHIFPLQSVLQMVVPYPVQRANDCGYTTQVSEDIKRFRGTSSLYHRFHGKGYAIKGLGRRAWSMSHHPGTKTPLCLMLLAFWGSNGS